MDGSSSIARRAGLSEFLIGMTIVGIGTSLPELVVSLTGALMGSADIAIGNVVGSNIFNVFLILGVTALIRPVAISDGNKRRDIPLNIAACLLLICFGMQHTLFGLGGSDTINAWEGGVFLLLFITYLIFSIKGGKADDGEQPEPSRKLWFSILMVVVGMAALIFGGDILVDSACRIALNSGLSEKFIAITISFMVFNDTKVVPARLHFERESGAHIEIFCLEPVQPCEYNLSFAQTGHCTWKCVIGNAKRWKGDILHLSNPENDLTVSSMDLSASLVERDGQTGTVELSWKGGFPFSQVLEICGTIPIPPYLNRDTEAIDSERYQTR